MSLCLGDCLVCQLTDQTVIHTVTITKCHIDTVISPDDGHIFAQNMQRKEINVLRKTAHQVEYIYKMR